MLHNKEDVFHMTENGHGLLQMKPLCLYLVLLLM